MLSALGLPAFAAHHDQHVNAVTHAAAAATVVDIDYSPGQWVAGALDGIGGSSVVALPHQQQQRQQQLLLICQAAHRVVCWKSCHNASAPSSLPVKFPPPPSSSCVTDDRALLLLLVLWLLLQPPQ